MRRAATVLLAAVITMLAGPAMAGTASALAPGEVLVFGTEFTPVTAYQDPHGCQKLQIDAHVLVNRTDRPVTVYADPFCLTPGLTVAPGYGSHVAPGSGSFSA
jgi:hypothetical protein